MRLAAGALVLTLWLAGCASRDRTRAAATPPVPKSVEVTPPPEPELSTPQTSVHLPSPQPISPEALASIPQPAPEPPEPPEVVRPKPSRRPVAAAPAPPKPEATVEVVPQPEAPRPRLQTLMTAEERRRLSDQMDGHRREINERLAQVAKNPSEQQQTVISRIRSFLSLCDQAVKRGDMRQAHSLSERALVLARDLQSAR